MSRYIPVDAVENVSRDAFDNEIRPTGRPVILKGLAAEWPCVAEARKGTESLALYLSQFETGRSTKVSVLPETEASGRFFYSQDLKGYNFTTDERTVTQLTRDLASRRKETLYMQAQPVDALLPGLAKQIDMPLLDSAVRPRVWIGNSLTTQTHYDLSENIACHVAGRKVFTLFAPDQIGNLYPGPLLGGPGGVPVSLVDLDNPDLEAHPRFADALENMWRAELEPGDALYIPSMWWHHVRTEGPLNLLVNYWWNDTRKDAYPPLAGLLVAALSIKQMPEPMRSAWRHWVDYYIFEAAGDPGAHLPAEQRGFFDRDMTAQQLEMLKSLVRQNV